MGLFIFAAIQEDIEQKKWEAIYSEILTMLRKFPAPLLRYTLEPYGNY